MGHKQTDASLQESRHMFFSFTELFISHLSNLRFLDPDNVSTILNMLVTISRVELISQSERSSFAEKFFSILKGKN